MATTTQDLTSASLAATITTVRVPLRTRRGTEVWFRATPEIVAQLWQQGRQQAILAAGPGADPTPEETRPHFIEAVRQRATQAISTNADIIQKAGASEATRAAQELAAKLVITLNDLLTPTAAPPPSGDAYQQHVLARRQAQLAPAADRRAPWHTRVTRKGWMIIGVVALVALISIYSAIPKGPSKSVAAYCKTVQVGHTTALNTTLTLGNPDSTVTHDGTLYLAYGSVTFYYDDLGSQDADILAGAKGC